MFNEKMEKAFNKQLNEELYSAYLYQSMAAHFEAKNWTGSATWMAEQAKEEMVHAMKFYHHILERGGRVQLAAIDAPKVEWSSHLDAFEDSYKHECHISKCIHDLVKLARDENDYPSEIFLHWFVTEQVEEEASVDDVVQKLKRVKESSNALFYLDKFLGKRGQPSAQTEEK